MQSQKQENDLFVSKANHSISQLSQSMPQPVTLKKLKLNGSMKTYKTLKDVLFVIGDWNAKVGSQETPRVTGKFDLLQENTLLIANTLFQQHKRRLYTWTSPDGQQ